MKDLNEFGRKGKRHRSLDGGRKRKAITPQWQYDVSETEEEDSISDADLEKDNKSKSFSKISRIFNKIYADHFERPIRMKQIKERNNRNINTLGDTPINEDSHDSSEESREEHPSENSSSNLSFKRRYVRTFFDKIDKPENKTVSASQKYYEIISEPILEGEEENEGAENNSLIRSETYEKFKSRHNRWKFFDNVLDAKEPGTSRRKSFMKTTSSFDNEPIVEENIEENDEENEQVDPYYHHFKRSFNPDETKSTDKQVEDLL